MNKIYKSLLLLGFVVLVSIGVTQAFFSDTETSSGNTFVAGKVDLKIDHTKQTYNDVDCRTCSVILKSDTSNLVVEKNSVDITPTPAVLAWTHDAWTAEEDPILDAANAEWIWATNPTTTEDAVNGVEYTFQKTFNWMGPIVGSDLWFGVGSDNSVEVWLNGYLIGANAGEFGYKKESMLHIDDDDITAKIVQGVNTLEFKVTNFVRPDDDSFSNPGGLVYKFEINGLCGDDYFKRQCRLWDEKDLEDGDVVWNFDDVKPGDRGINVISYHVYDNDAYMCTYLNPEDIENGVLEPETTAGDPGETLGELSKYIEVFVWKDLDGDGNYDDGETGLVPDGTLLGNLTTLPIAEPTPGPAVPGNSTNYLGIAWCFGDLTAVADSSFTCSGVGDQNDAQSDKLTETIKFYVEQARNNENFSCSKVLPTVAPTETPE